MQRIRPSARRQVACGSRRTTNAGRRNSTRGPGAPLGPFFSPGAQVKHDEAGEDAACLRAAKRSGPAASQIAESEAELLSEQVSECAHGVDLLMTVDR